MIYKAVGLNEYGFVIRRLNKQRKLISVILVSFFQHNNMVKFCRVFIFAVAENCHGNIGIVQAEGMKHIYRHFIILFVACCQCYKASCHYFTCFGNSIPEIFLISFIALLT